MNILNTSKKIFISSVILALCACTNSKSFSNVMTADMVKINQNPALYQKSSMRIGGQILSVNSMGDLTEIEILVLPLAQSGRPTEGLSQGRILAIIKTPKNINKYLENTLITIIGSVSGKRSVIIENKATSQIIFEATEQYIWPKKTTRDENKNVLGFKTIGSGAPNPGFGFDIPLKPRY